MRIFGEDQPQMIAQRITFDPRWGRVLQEDYRGAPKGIAALDLLLSAQGYKTDVVKMASAHLLTVTYGRDPSEVTGQPEQPVDTWELTAERDKVAIWNHPVVVMILKPLSAAQTSKAIKLIEAAVDAGETFPNLDDEILNLLDQARREGLATIFHLLVLGVKVYPAARAVLRRRRTFSGNFAERMALDRIEKFYTTAKLIEAFAVPAVIAAQLPADPGEEDTPTPLKWGWVQTAFSSDISPAINRIEEKREWRFAACPPILFDVV